MIWVAVALWIVSGVIGYGRTLHDFTYSFAFICHDYARRNRNTALMVAIMGPIGWLVSAIFGKAGWGLCYRPDTKAIQNSTRRRYHETWWLEHFTKLGYTPESIPPLPESLSGLSETIH